MQKSVQVSFPGARRNPTGNFSILRCRSCQLHSWVQLNVEDNVIFMLIILIFCYIQNSSQHDLGETSDIAIFVQLLF